MKWKSFIWFLIALSTVGAMPARANGGNYFSRNYLPEEYGAHNRNFDIVGDDYGRIFVANFEGLLYYDQKEWRVLHSPGINRFTSLYKDRSGRIWCGGYNFLGYLTAAKNGELRLEMVFSNRNKGLLGEVTGIAEENGRICIYSSLGTTELEDDALKDYIVRKTQEDNRYYGEVKVNDRLVMPDGSILLATAGNGLVHLNADGSRRLELTEANGLCNNNVNALYADTEGHVWGATDDGIFLTSVNSIYTIYGESEGLTGEVNTILQTDEQLYVGTLQGLFYRKGHRFERVQGIHNACWQLKESSNGGVFACTAEGLFHVVGRAARQLTTSHSFSVYPLANGDIFSGETDGVYLYSTQGSRTQVNKIEKVFDFIKEADDLYWIRNIYGQIYRCSADLRTTELLQLADSEGKTESANLLMFRQQNTTFFVSSVGLFKWNAAEGRMVPVDRKYVDALTGGYPQLVYPEGTDRIWYTDKEGKQLKVFAYTDPLDELNAEVYPLHNLSIQTMAVRGDDWWCGGHFGLIHCLKQGREPDFDKTPKLYIRSIVMDNDSVVWGGFNRKEALNPRLPFRHIDFGSDISAIRLTYSTDAPSTLGDADYRFRTDVNQSWSEWSSQGQFTLANPRPGSYKLEVMARDRYGRIIEPVSLSIHIAYPFYLRWYAWVSYVVILGLGIFFFIKARMRRLLNEKKRLEDIVEARTSQIRQQKDEIEEKSKNLEKALDDLEKAQFELIRKEKMATVGTLTQGLVDRILNPMNYVNNFSHMSIGLVDDLKQNMEDDEEKMTPDIFEDSMDVIDMLGTNLKKIEEHGINTTKILKAMEEMLKEKGQNRTPGDIVALCRKNIEMLHQYSQKDIDECKIKVEVEVPEAPVMVAMDAEQISRTMMSVLNNSVYALKKKYQKGAYEAVLRLGVSVEDGMVALKVYDNGIGIEELIIDKIFDPFFTTKPTAEAVGVGMYMSREVILNHGGEIKVASNKDEYTEFIVTLPVKQPEDK